MATAHHINGNGNGDTVGPTFKKYWIGGKLKHLPHLNKAAARRVDLRHNPRDFLVCLLAASCFSTKCIATKTGYSQGQITYRLQKANISRKDARDGKTPLARRILNQAIISVAPLMGSQLPKALNPVPKHIHHPHTHS